MGAFKLWQKLRNSGQSYVTSLARWLIGKNMGRLMRFITLIRRLNFAGETISMLMCAKQTIELSAVLTAVYYGSHGKRT